MRLAGKCALAFLRCSNLGCVEWQGRQALVAALPSTCRRHGVRRARNGTHRPTRRLLSSRPAPMAGRVYSTAMHLMRGSPAVLLTPPSTVRGGRVAGRLPVRGGRVAGRLPVRGGGLQVASQYGEAGCRRRIRGCVRILPVVHHMGDFHIWVTSIIWVTSMRAS